MRRFPAMLSLAVLAAGALAGVALAKEGGVEIASLPVGLKSGEPWETTLRLVEEDPAAEPGIRIRNSETGRVLSFPATSAKAAPGSGEYLVRVVFPARGLWSVEAYDGASGRAYAIGGPFYVAGPKAPAPASQSAGAAAGFPVWPALGGTLGLLLPATGAALFLRRRR